MSIYYICDGCQERILGPGVKFTLITGAEFHMHNRYECIMAIVKKYYGQITE